MFFRLCGSRFSKLKIEFAGDVTVDRCETLMLTCTGAKAF